MAPDVDIATLRLLVAVEETSSISGAARRVGISQPAATARIREFEARWRVSVLKRSPRGTDVTQDGQAVTTWARAVLRETDTMRTALQALGQDRSASLALAASLTVAEFVLPAWLGELHTRRPDVHPRLHMVNSDHVLEMVRSGSVDVGFIESVSRPHDLGQMIVGRDELLIAVAPGHPWAGRSGPVRREELAEALWVLREEGSGTRSTFEAALGVAPALALEVSSTTALVGAAMAGVGPTVVSSLAIAAQVEAARLVPVSSELALTRPLTAVWQTGRRLPDPVSELIRIASATPRGARPAAAGRPKRAPGAGPGLTRHGGDG